MIRPGGWCLLLLAALQAAGSPADAQGSKGHRVFPSGQWAPAGGVPPGDETLANPYWLAADDSTIYVFDLADATLKAFAYDGRVRWRFGRAGKGPGEFVSATDVQLDTQGHIWIADGGTLRLTRVSVVVDRDGKEKRRVAVPPLPRLVPPAQGGNPDCVGEGPSHRAGGRSGAGGLRVDLPVDATAMRAARSNTPQAGM